MKAIQLYMSVSTPTYIAELEDSTLRWVRPDFGGLLDGGPCRQWFDRGLRARSASWGGKPSIEPAHEVMLNTLNRALAT
jgi:hypothetical protein